MTKEEREKFKKYIIEASGLDEQQAENLIKTMKYTPEEMSGIIKFFKKVTVDEKSMFRLSDGSEDFLNTSSSPLYHLFRKKIAQGDFKTEHGEPWPAADLGSSKVTSKAYIKPDGDGALYGESLLEMQEAMKNKVMDLAKKGDLAADVFDTITAKWLNEAGHFEAMINITADDFLKARGLKAKKAGSGRRGGYEEEQRQEIQEQIDTLSYTWITVHEMEITEEVNGKRKKTKWRGESKAIDLSSRFGQVKLDGSVDAYAWRIRPGDVFAKFLFGPGRQVALLSTKALQYDHYRQKWEKRLARYLAWIWRIDTGRTQEGISVKTLINAVGEEINKGRPNRTKDRLETALDQLEKDGVISLWDYEIKNPSLYERRGWWREWLELKIIITAPQEILNQYKVLNDAKKAAAKIPEKAKKR